MRLLRTDSEGLRQSVLNVEDTIAGLLYFYRDFAYQRRRTAYLLPQAFDQGGLQRGRVLAEITFDLVKQVLSIGRRLLSKRTPYRLFQGSSFRIFQPRNTLWGSKL